MTQEKREFLPTFENGGYWEYYKDLERQFQNFLEYVPYLDGNEKTYSFRLANLILAIGGYVDSAFKEMLKWPIFTPKYDALIKKFNEGRGTIADYRKLEPEYCLSKRIVIFKQLQERVLIIPFKEFEAMSSPKWWTEHNDVKHDLSENLVNANLKNARDGLAGAFMLNAIHIPAYIKLVEIGVVTPLANERGESRFSKLSEGWKDSLRKNLVENHKMLGFAETQIFIYDYKKGSEDWAESQRLLNTKN